jgi:Zn finger protein HypA/HybF involved in hydrogenase expression
MSAGPLFLFREIMKNQTKTFINFGEIAAFHFRCKTCALELTVPFGADFTRTRTAQKCPGCGDSWLQVNDGSAVPALANLVESIRTISQWPGVCEVSIEV